MSSFLDHMLNAVEHLSRASGRREPEPEVKIKRLKKKTKPSDVGGQPGRQAAFDGIAGPSECCTAKRE